MDGKTGQENQQVYDDVVCEAPGRGWENQKVYNDVVWEATCRGCENGTGKPTGV